MRKQPLLWILALVILSMLSLSAAADEKVLASEEEIASFFRECRDKGTEQFEFVCDEETYRLVSADRFSRLLLLEKKNGIRNADVMYNNARNLLELRDVTYEDVPWTECADEEAVRDAVIDFGEQRLPEFRIFTDPALCQALYDSNHLFMYGALAGMDDPKPKYYVSQGLIEFGPVEYSSLPRAYAADEQEFLSAVESFAADEKTDFCVCFEPAFFDTLSGGVLKQMQAMSQLETYYYRTDRYRKTIEYTDVTFSYVPRAVCGTEADIVREIRTMGASGAVEFRLILGEELYGQIKEDNFRKLHELEAEAGLKNCDMRYSWSDYVLYYENAEIVTEAVKLETMDDVTAYMLQQSEENAPEITLFCSGEVYDRLMEGLTGFTAFRNSMAPLYDVAALAGLQVYTVSYSALNHVITFEGIRYYAGTNMIRAFRANDATGLTDREMEAMQAAVQLAHDLKTDDDLMTAMNIHDYIAENVVYADDGNSDENDNAIGALLNGRADCDGYADAFCAVGTLAGLNVRCQHGDSYSIGPDFDILNSVTHMWNLLEIDGTWRLVDVTWDDGEDGVSHTWFNLGLDRASRMHIWNEDTTVALDPVTDLSVRPMNEFTVGSEEDFIEDLAYGLESGMDPLYFIWEDPEAAPDNSSLAGLVRERTDAGFRYFWNDRMKMFSVWDFTDR